MNYERPPLLEQLAADYVLGVLRSRARARFEALSAGSSAVAAARRRWEDRLLPWALACRPVMPGAALWPAIEQRISQSTTSAPTPADRGRRVARRFNWRIAVAASVVGIALLVGRLTVWQSPSWQPLAELAPAAAAPLWRVEQTADGARIQIRTVGRVTLPATQSYQLWILPRNGANPVSLGLLPRAGDLARDLTPLQREQLLSAAKLAVSIEPLNGSPTGLPTGPVVVVAPIERAG